MTLQQYSAENCQGDIVTVSGVPVGVCLVEYDSDQKPVGAMMYSCDSGEYVDVYVWLFQGWWGCEHWEYYKKV
jgi:hypothetical protein